MKRIPRLWLALAIVLLLATDPVAAGEVETLPAETALAQIQKMPGVVLVDLYADW